jgi:hypothetical protein
MKKIINNGDNVYATGVFLQRDTTANGGWIVMGFEDDTYHEGQIVNSDQNDDNTVTYYVGEDDDTPELAHEQFNTPEQ